MSTAWPHLKYLADFMEVSTTPLRWEFLRVNEAERSERLHRTECSQYWTSLWSGSPMRRNATSDSDLVTCLNDKSIATSVRLIVVEDLSRQVVEILGSKYDVDPAFFREHINDYSWYNIRDRWMVPRSLKSSIRQQKWTRVRYVRPRYLKTKEAFQRAREESNRFNVLRRPDDDQNQWAFMDGEAIVALTRTKALLWVGTNYGQGDETIGRCMGFTIVL